ncbi:MAG: YybS family protein [Gemmatimonadota bacterium]|nr:YybS family protein [Gemmatimonadota bacterium]
MADAATSDNKSQSWRPLLWGLAAFLLLPFVPLADVIFPVQQTLLLLVPALAVCSIIGWRSGSRAALALIWLGLAVWMLLQPAGPPGTAYDQMARAWAIVLSASFGLLSLLSSATPFFVRALASVGVTLAVALTIALSSPSGIARFQHAGGEEFMRRTAVTLGRFQEKWDTEQWKNLTARAPLLQAADDWTVDIERDLPKRTIPLIPALLALESLAALGLAWGVYHRLSQVRIGPALGPLTEFRFNDQLIWALAVGLTLSLLPAFSDGRNAGFNLLLFFGALYAVRGLGVLAWISKGRYVFIIVLSLIPQGVLLLGVLALALGLGDTWLDLRRRARAT